MTYMDLDDMDRMSPMTAKILLGCYALMSVWWFAFIFSK